MGGRQGNFPVCGPTRYVMTVAPYGLTFDLDRVRRERHEFWGELIVKCDLKGAKTLDGILSASDFNLSGQTSRSTRAKYLAERAQTDEIDWVGLLEEFCQRVIVFDREGADAPALKDIPPPEKGDGWTVDGLTLLQRQPVILFGDGGQGKSLVALYLAGHLAQRGIRVLYCDWEFDGESHRERFGGLFGAAMPEGIRYCRCDKPLGAEMDRIRRLVKQYEVHYLICDSIVFACAAGVPAESAEAASTYFQALRQIGVGSFNLAHTTKQSNEKDDTRQQYKPFGSGFWHNGARATWFLKGVEEGRGRLAVGLFPRKANTGPLGPALGWVIDFAGGSIQFNRTDVAEHGELVGGLKVWERMREELKTGPYTMAALASSLDVPVNTIVQEVKRKTGLFTKVEGADGIFRVGLVTGSVQ